MKSVFLARPDAAEVQRSAAGVGGWLWVWLPAVLACCVIACESTKTMSGANTSGWLRPWFQGIFGQVSDSAWGEIHHLIRKTGHFVGYGTVCLTFLRGWLLTLARRTESGIRVWRFRACLLGVASTFVVASCDEFHQTFLVGRQGQISDVLLDTCGGCAMCLVVAVVCRWGR